MRGLSHLVLSSSKCLSGLHTQQSVGPATLSITHTVSLTNVQVPCGQNPGLFRSGPRRRKMGRRQKVGFPVWHVGGFQQGLGERRGPGRHHGTTRGRRIPSPQWSSVCIPTYRVREKRDGSARTSAISQPSRKTWFVLLYTIFKYAASMLKLTMVASKLSG